MRKIWLDDPAGAEAYGHRLRVGMATGADRLAAPTLLMRGSSSDVVTLEAAHKLLAMIPQARLVDVEDSAAPLLAPGAPLS